METERSSLVAINKGGIAKLANDTFWKHPHLAIYRKPKDGHLTYKLPLRQTRMVHHGPTN